MAISKVVYGNQTLLDISMDTVEASKLLSGYTAHGSDGESIVGSCTYDSDTSDATIQASEVLYGEIAYGNGQKIVGSMPNIGAQESVISSKNQQITISQGYHDGTGNVSIDSTEQAKIIAGNIKNGVQILGVTGTYTGSELIKATTLSATPYTSAQTVLPSSLGDYDYFTQVTIAAIAYSEVPNAGGGMTATIGTVAPN